MNLSGKCLCGSIQFTLIPKDNMDAHVCHCSYCRRWTGGISMTLTCQHMPTFQKGKALLKTYKSSEWGERCFCSNCGTNLFVNCPKYGYYGVCPGTLEDNDQAKLKLAGEIFIDKKPAFYNFAGNDWKKMTEAEFHASVTEEAKEGEEPEK